jgi:pilus assembly protein CpaB
MMSARVMVLAVSIVAGGFAAYLASGSTPVAAPPKIVQLPSVEVLVAKADIGLGQTVTPDKIEWQAWPQSAMAGSFIRRSERAEAMMQLAGSLARAPFVAGEPIREAKLVKINGSGFMAAVLSSGMRAISIPITPETGAGGFILPNDRVDVILSKREKDGDNVRSQVIVKNIRVLAIDQAPREREGQPALIGKTATLEASAEQAETLARTRMDGTLSLALRSLVDAEAADKGPTKRIAIYRGVGAQSVYSCKPVCDLQ